MKSEIRVSTDSAGLNVQPYKYVSHPGHSSASDAYPPAEVAAMAGINPQVYDLDLERLHRYRIDRIHAEMDQRGCDALLLFDPINIRYSTGARNMQIWTMHHPARYVLVVRGGPIILFEIGGRVHHAENLPLIDEVRLARPWFYYYSGSDSPSHAADFAAEIAALIGRRSAGSPQKRVLADRCDTRGIHALEGQGLWISDDGQELMEHARAIKSDDEISAIRMAIDVCEAGIKRIRDNLRPGVTELSLLSQLHQANIELGGEYIETRLLTSGHRTNPFHQESSHKIVRAGEMVTFDCDLIGPLGYGADLSRAYVCQNEPTAEQKSLYRLAYDQIMSNTELLKVGATFDDIIRQAKFLPDGYRQWHRIAHGNGMSTGEFPAIGRRPGYAEGTIHQGQIEEGMVLCVGTFAGREDGGEGVKLEHQLVIRAHGPERLSSSLYEASFLGGGHGHA